MSDHKHTPMPIAIYECKAKGCGKTETWQRPEAPEPSCDWCGTVMARVETLHEDPIGFEGHRADGRGEA